MEHTTSTPNANVKEMNIQTIQKQKQAHKHKNMAFCMAFSVSYLFGVNEMVMAKQKPTSLFEREPAACHKNVDASMLSVHTSAGLCMLLLYCIASELSLQKKIKFYRKE